MLTFLLFIISAFWGSTFIFCKILLEDYGIPISMIVAFRFTIACLIFTLLFFKRIKFTRRVVKNGSIIALINAIALVVQLAGLQYTTATNSAFITTTYIIFLPIIEYFFWKTKMVKTAIWGILFSLAGVYLLSFPDLAAFSVNPGDLITLFCGFLYAFQIFFISHYSKDENIYTLVFLQFGITALAGWLYLGSEMVFMDKTIPFGMIANAGFLKNMITLAIVGTFIPFALQFYVQKRVTPTVAGVAYLLEPVFAVILASIMLNEQLTMQSAGGMLLIFCGLFIVNKVSN